MIPLCLGVIGYAIGILASEISLIALLATFPLFLFCYMWGWFKNMFSMWLQAIMGSCLFLLFLSIFSKVGFQIAKYTNNWVSQHQGSEVFIACFMYTIAGVITVYGIQLSGQISSALSQVSIDKLSPAMTKHAASKDSVIMKLASKKLGGLLSKKT